MECYENGILNKERTGGLDLNFGNSDDALEMLHQLAGAKDSVRLQDREFEK